MVDYTPEIINQVWQKALVQDNNNPDVFRKDYAGAWIRRDSYNQKDEYGWVIELIIPESAGGKADDESNLIPSFWRNQLSRANYQEWITHWKAEGEKNVETDQEWVLG